jgi:hypothetical protein
MSAFTEFVCVAIALYFWESTLWIPLHGVALRRGWSAGKWKILDPGALFATRETGMIAMRPFPADSGLAPCQAPPLIATEGGGFLLRTAPEGYRRVSVSGWSDLREESHHLVVGTSRVRISSPRCIKVLQRAKRRGATPAEAVRQVWRMALSPTRANREWLRWKLVSRQLRLNGPVLTVGFFIGLPLTYAYMGTLQTLMLGGWLWCVMAWTASQLWWLGKRVYPDARPALRMDAMLSLLVPFHAMRALEIASVHAMGTTHPVGLILSSRNLENPWLGRFVRGTLYPVPGQAEDGAFQAALRPLLAHALALCGMTPEDFDLTPKHADDPDATRYCPRCHSLYQVEVASCADCPGVIVKKIPTTTESPGRN